MFLPKYSHFDSTGAKEQQDGKTLKREYELSWESEEIIIRTYVYELARHRNCSILHADLSHIVCIFSFLLGISYMPHSHTQNQKKKIHNTFCMHQYNEI